MADGCSLLLRGHVCPFSFLHCPTYLATAYPFFLLFLPSSSQPVLRCSQRILEEQRRQDEKRRVKRAANRKSASTSRARKKAFVDDMTAKNERMKQHALVLAMLPDLVLAVCRTGEMTYVSPACQWLLLHSPDEITGANIFELVTHDCHPLLRRMISENLSRPMQTQTQQNVSTRDHNNNETDGSEDEQDRSADEGQSSSSSSSSLSSLQSAPLREKLGNHRVRLQERYRQSQAARHNGGNSSSEASRGGGTGRLPVAISPPHERKMLRLIRCDKTTVWCESRLSVRTAKADSVSNSMPLEIILTLRTVSEGNKTSMSNGIAGARVSEANNPPTAAMTESASFEDNEYVGADDDGYQCEVEEDGNNSGSGNDSGMVRNSKCNNIERNSCSGDMSDAKKRAEAEQEAGAPSDRMEGREERSLTKKRQRQRSGSLKEIEDMMSSVSSGGAVSSKAGENDSSTGGDTGGSTTQESNGADSNGEGSNNGSSKWGDGCSGDLGFKNDGSRCEKDDCGGSEDSASSDTTSSGSGRDLGEEVQSAVQSLILMGGSVSKGPQ